MTEKCSLAKGVKIRKEIIATMIIFVSLLFLRNNNNNHNHNSNNNSNGNINSNNNRNVWRKRNVAGFLLHVACKCSLSLSLLCTSSRLSHLAADIRDVNTQDQLEL
jgi:hypothetical protein